VEEPIDPWCLMFLDPLIHRHQPRTAVPHPKDARGEGYTALRRQQGHHDPHQASIPGGVLPTMEKWAEKRGVQVQANVFVHEHVDACY